MSLNKVVLLACGSFNPPTNMHLRMFELAKDHLHRLGNHLVVGGFISPVHDSYGKTDLVSAKHRIAMLKLALDDNSWIKVSDWESRQETWTRTRQSLNYHQNAINSKLNVNGFDANSNESDHLYHSIVPDYYQNILDTNSPVQVKLLCGADLLESFGTPGLWANEDIEAIVGQYGLVVITRENSNPLKFIYNSDILTKYMGNIIIVTEWITNEVSSTKIRRALRRSESVKYLIPDKVINYIQDNTLFGTSNKTKYLMPPSLDTYNHNFLTPSPTGTSDMSIDTPSPMSCMNLCNNNLFTAVPATGLSIDVPDVGKSILSTPKPTVVVSATAAKSCGGSVKHPGQAVKIVTKVVKEVRTPATTPSTALKNSKSCTELAQLAGGGKSGGDKNTSRSNDDLLDRKSCDENLIRFIFTKHGIQVISDVETIV